MNVRFDRIDRGYTDWAAIIAPNIRWAFQDALVLRKETSAFLGYNILLLAPTSVNKVRGMRLSKIVIVGDGHVYRRDVSTLLASLSWAYFPHVEKWNANPGRGPVERVA